MSHEQGHVSPFASQPSSTTRSEPRTSNGRALAAVLADSYDWDANKIRNIILAIEAEAAPPPPAPLDGFTSDELVAELRRRNLRLHTTDELLAGLSEPEILDFVDAGAVTAEQARAYLARLTSESSE